MKKIIILFSMLSILACKSKKGVNTNQPETNKIVKLNSDELSEIQKNKAYELGTRVLMTCNTSRFKPFTINEATASVIKNTTEERLTKTCIRFRQYYGTFIDLELIETYINKEDLSVTFRYKASYSKKVANKELRVIMNPDNRISSIKSLDWRDAL